MKTLIKTIAQHLFVASTSIAALLHSMWTISHLLGGLPPEQTAPIILQLGYWLPGLLVALSLDIGLLSTSAEIRHGVRNKTRFTTLAVLSLSMFYLQSVYAVLHFDVLPLGRGVPTSAIQFFSAVRDYGVLIVPILMPISILLYSFGHEKEKQLATPSDSAIKPKARPMIIFSKKRIDHWTPPKGVQAPEMVDKFPLVLPPSQNGHNREIVPTADGE